MNRKKWLIIILVAVAAFAGYKFFLRSYSKDTIAERPSEPLLGVYDRSKTGQEQAIFDKHKHIAIRWNNSGRDDFIDDLKKIMPGTEPVLITVEVWPSVADKFSKENILSLIANGTFDKKITGFGDFLSNLNQVIMIRLNPEMEVYVNRYPWQMQASELYTKAFRHFSETLKGSAPAVKMVWAPAGYPGTEEYWPGARWVDMVSVTLKSRSEGMTSSYPEENSLSQLILRKLHRMRFFDKPVLVMGSEKVTKENFQKPSFDSAVAYIQQNKETEYRDLNEADRETESAVLRKTGALITGIFDPAVKLVDSVPVSAEHLFVNLQELKDGISKKEFDAAVSRNHDLIITMEPWKDKRLEKDPMLMDNILAGKYDPVFNELYAIISSTNRTVYLRWLHEMEIPITRYPWQSQDPVKYIKAFRYFVNYIRSKKPVNVFFVWGPAGDRGSMEFWPGSDVVDYTSIAIYGLPDKNITDHNRQESFNTIFKRKYHRIWFAHKPLFITEFGVKGPASYKQRWLTDAANTIEQNAEITGVSYFNFTDNPKAWGNIEAPDWSISPVIFSQFQQQLKTSLKQ